MAFVGEHVEQVEDGVGEGGWVGGLQHQPPSPESAQGLGVGVAVERAEPAGAGSGLSS